MDISNGPREKEPDMTIYAIRNRRDVANLLTVVDSRENDIEDMRHLQHQAADLMNACYSLNVTHCPDESLNAFIKRLARKIEILDEEKQDILGQIVLAEAMFDEMEANYRVPEID
jgi:hypothetical protein